MNSLNFNPLNISTSILTNDKKLLKVVDVMGREVIVKPNTIQLKRNILISRLNVFQKIYFHLFYCISI